MEKVWNELLSGNKERENLSILRQMIKESSGRQQFRELCRGSEDRLIAFLESDDAKTRKNAALLLGEISGTDDAEAERIAEALWNAYRREDTLFVKSAYVTALSHFDMTCRLHELKDRLECLIGMSEEDENRKHADDEIRALRKLLVEQEGTKKHTFCAGKRKYRVLLLSNREQRDAVLKSVRFGAAKLHPLGVEVETERLQELFGIRTFRELLFLLDTGMLPAEKPEDLAKKLWESDLWEVVKSLHQEPHPFYFRVECPGSMDLAERSAFTRKLAAALERCSGGSLCNSTSDYEIELRLIASKEGNFLPCLKLFTVKDERFSYRKNAVSGSIHPSTAALVAELSEPYLKKRAQIMDPFCGVGTMLIERNLKVPAREMYATDIFGDAVRFGRENAEAAGAEIRFIHRDFFDFKHDRLFDEIITNMPLRGKKTKEETDLFYGRFFEKARKILAKDAVIIMYTNELGFVKKQLRLHKEYKLLQEFCMQKKTEFYLLIIQRMG